MRLRIAASLTLAVVAFSSISLADSQAGTSSASGSPVAASAASVLSRIEGQISARLDPFSPLTRRWFLVIYAYQNEANDPAKSHVFASFIEADGPSVWQQKWTSISWIPATFYIDHKLCFYHSTPEKCTPVDGTNYSTYDTLDFAEDDRRQLAVWGPYEITEDLFNLGVQRRAELDDDLYKYIVVDYGYRERGEAFNCMHAVSDIGGILETYGGPGDSGLGVWGFTGGERVVRHYKDKWKKFILDPLDPAKFWFAQMK